jgi:ferredoxin
VLRPAAVYRIEIDQDECMSAGRCVADLPQVFSFDDDDLAVAHDDGTADPDAVLRVARTCPSQAIHLFDPAGDPVPL